MSQNLDKNKICNSIQKSKPQDLLCLIINPVDKDSKKSVLFAIEKFVGKNQSQIVIYK